MDPTSNTHLLACTNKGLYLSLNGAATWTKSCGSNLPCDSNQEVPCNSLAQYPGTQTLYLTLQTQTTLDQSTPPWSRIELWKGGVYKSTNFGSDWSEKRGSEEVNTLPNPGLDCPGGDPMHPVDQWEFFAGVGSEGNVSRDCMTAHGGTLCPTGWESCSVKVTTATSSGAGIISGFLPIQPGAQYKISAWDKVNYTPTCPNPPGMSTFRATVYYYTAPDAASGLYWPGRLGDNAVHLWGDPGLVHAPNEDNGEWRYFESLIHPPDLATYMKIQFYTDDNGGCYTGQTFIDDVSLQVSHSLPRIGGITQQFKFSSYDRIVVDPTDPDVVYVGTNAASTTDILYADTAGVWKSSDGGDTSWTLVTRGTWHDNVLDGILTAPVCGNGTCEGRWETCNTCPTDCTVGGTGYCCGDGQCTAPNENRDNCQIDCHDDPDSTPRPYQEAFPHEYNVPTLAIGGPDPIGHKTLFMGPAFHLTTDGGLQWNEVSSDLFQDPPGGPYDGSWKARGATNNVVTLFVVTDSTPDGKIYYGDIDKFLQISLNSGQSFVKEGDVAIGQFSPPISGDAVTSLVRDSAVPNRIYCGISSGSAGYQFQSLAGGAAQADYVTNPANKYTWDWSPLGDQTTFPKGGGVELARHFNGTFYAAIYTHGVYKLGTDNCWTPFSEGLPQENSVNPPEYRTYRLASEPTSKRLYVSIGSPTPVGDAAEFGPTGIWQRDDGAAGWVNIFSPVDNPQAPTNYYPLTTLLPAGPSRIFAGV